MNDQSEERARLLRLSRQLDFRNNPCRLCRKRAAIGSKVHLAYNFGVGFSRVEGHVEGDFCGRCVSKKFASFTVTNLFGWFGFVSMVKAPYFLLSNCDEYVQAIRHMMKKRRQRTAAVDDLIAKTIASPKSTKT
jgi:hypothetical protein